MYNKADYFDLYASGSGKLQFVVQQKLGGRYAFKDLLSVNKGVSGLEFTDQIDGNSLHYRVTAELFRKGIGLYFRTYRNNYFLPVPFEDINNIHIYKSADVIQPMGFSMYGMMTKMGFDYMVARNFLTANEITALHPIRIEIIKADGTQIPLKVRRINPAAIFNFFRQPAIAQLTTFQVVR